MSVAREAAFTPQANILGELATTIVSDGLLEDSSALC